MEKNNGKKWNCALQALLTAEMYPTWLNQDNASGFLLDKKANFPRLCHKVTRKYNKLGTLLRLLPAL